MTNGPKRGEKERRKKRRPEGRPGKTAAVGHSARATGNMQNSQFAMPNDSPCRHSVDGPGLPRISYLSSPLSFLLSLSFLFSPLLFALLGHLFDSTFDYFYDRIAFYCFYFWSRNVGQVDIVISFFFCCLRSHTAYEQLPATTCEISWQNEVSIE